MVEVKIRKITATRTTPETDLDVANLINEVYDVSEAGMWVEQMRRITPAEITTLTNTGNLFRAYIDGILAGTISLAISSAEAVNFGMLAVHPNHIKGGIGRQLVAFVENWGKENGYKIMECGVVYPTHWQHPSKGFLIEWYKRMGYKEVSIGPMAEFLPHLVKSLKTECSYLALKKELN